MPEVGGKKELTGRTDIEIEISNQCARLIANTIIFYNSAILSRLVTKYEAAGNSKALALITKFRLRHGGTSCSTGTTPFKAAARRSISMRSSQASELE